VRARWARKARLAEQREGAQADRSRKSGGQRGRAQGRKRPCGCGCRCEGGQRAPPWLEEEEAVEGGGDWPSYPPPEWEDEGEGDWD
jgi:hypothetical protein